MTSLYIFNGGLLSKTTVLLSFLLFAFLVVPGQPALAADPLPPYTVPPEPQPPPVGDGNTPQPVIAGDQGMPDPPPSGEHDPTHGNWFPPQQSPGIKGQQHLHLRRDDRGDRIVRSRPAASTSNSATSLDALFAIESDQYPYPPDNPDDKRAPTEPGQPVTRPRGSTNRAVTARSRKIIGDLPDNQPLQRRRNVNNQHNTTWEATERALGLPTVKKFARLLVIAGVVFGTVMVAFASFALTLGYPGAGARVTGSIAGLMLLLSSYAIYKIVMVNAWRQYDLTNVTNDVNNTALWRPTYVNPPQPNVPVTPAGDAGGRSGVPVVPLGNARNP